MRTLTPRERDAEIARIVRINALREGRIEESDQEWWERAKEQRDRSGSYQALEKALQSLTANDVHFLDLFYEGWIRHTPFARQREEMLVKRIAAVMPERIELPHGLYYQHSQKLVAVVKSLSSAGRKISEIGKELGISRRRIRGMLRTKST